MRFLRQQQPNDYTCLPTAFAIVIGQPIAELLEIIGHDGTGERKGFHVQEIVAVLYQQGWSVTQFDQEPRLYYPDDFIKTLSFDLNGLLVSTKGVICGTFQGQAHAAAWDGQLIFNPNGSLHDLSIVNEISVYYAIDRRA